MNITVFENRELATRLSPIALTRPVFELRCGAFSFIERIYRLRPNASISLFVRKELIEITKHRFPNYSVNPDFPVEGLWLNGGVFWNEEALQNLEKQFGTYLSNDGNFIGGNLSSEDVTEYIDKGGPVENTPNFKGRDYNIDSINFLWDCININGKALERDSKFFDMGKIQGEIDEDVHLLKSNNIYVDIGAKIRNSVIIDGESGPVIIENNTIINPGAYIEGPIHIGEGSIINTGAKIFGNTSIGKGCKVGGEITGSILQGWTNKQHDGFLGHSFLGEWINIGAGTNNSDLKNNYSSVHVSIDGQWIDTKSLFVGLFMGDHSKSGIGTRFNTGSVVGVACNIALSGFVPKSIPSFSWLVNDKHSKHKYEKFVETATVVKNRRGESFSDYEEKLFRLIAENNTL
ncbi:MAG: hypothetical protein CMG75_03475 [Candidatus Marinimicrobia bacterium]|nr:hypothetical protein [Candidatus Neomarinimicrobiota bacterium]|tara:strand:- start:4670 stop:5881 length:1212 start_codon:yes stop_codon:yes gene_type:complete